MHLIKFPVVPLCVLFILFCCVPITSNLDDGGTQVCQAVLWGVTKHHAIWQQDGQDGYQVGTSVRVLWFTVYDDREFIARPKTGNGLLME